MEKHKPELKEFYKEYKGPVWSLTSDDEKFLITCPTDSIKNAIKWFSIHKYDMLSKGFTHIVLPGGEEIEIKNLIMLSDE